jgi:hypothetical protein
MFTLFQALSIKKKYGKFLLPQLKDILLLRLFDPWLGASEYYSFRLWDEKIPFQEKRRFIGWRKQKVIQKSIKPDSTLDDKLRFYSILEGLNIPTPKIYAVYSCYGRYYGKAQSLKTEVDIRSFFYENRNLPMFSKPAHSDYGIGGYAISSYDQEKDRLILLNGKTKDLGAFINEIKEFKKSNIQGHIFQELLKPHDLLSKVFGTVVMTMRFVIIMTLEGASIHQILLKIPVGDNTHDNFHGGESGNYIAQVDINSGAIVKVISGVGINRKEIETHPLTNIKMAGILIPNWTNIVSSALQTATIFPSNCIQHWDIAICQDGPVYVEINSEGDFDLHQYCWSQGMYKDKLPIIIEKT